MTTTRKLLHTRNEEPRQWYVSEGSFTRVIEDCRFIRHCVAVRYVKSISNAHIYLVKRGR